MSGFTFTQTRLDGSTETGLPGLVYLSVKTGDAEYEIGGWVKPEVAALVKAAPALFEALKWTLSCLVAQFPKDKADAMPIVQLARAALAKVTGEEK